MFRGRKGDLAFLSSGLLMMIRLRRRLRRATSRSANLVRKVEYVGTASVMGSGMESPSTLRALSTWSTLNEWFYGRI